MASDISNTTVNFTGQNALKKDEGCARWKCICLTSLLVEFLILDLKVLKCIVSGSKSSPFVSINFSWSLYLRTFYGLARL